MLFPTVQKRVENSGVQHSVERLKYGSFVVVGPFWQNSRLSRHGGKQRKRIVQTHTNPLVINGVITGDAYWLLRRWLYVNSHRYQVRPGSLQTDCV